MKIVKHKCFSPDCQERGLFKLESPNEFGFHLWGCQKHAEEITQKEHHIILEIIPVVGMGATESVGSDSYPYTIIEVSPSEKTIVVQQDIAKPDVGHEYFGAQKYVYTPNVDANKRTYTLRKNGRWYQKGESMGYMPLCIGHRRYYSDPSH